MISPVPRMRNCRALGDQVTGACQQIVPAAIRSRARARGCSARGFRPAVQPRRRVRPLLHPEPTALVDTSQREWPGGRTTRSPARAGDAARFSAPRSRDAFFPTGGNMPSINLRSRRHRPATDDGEARHQRHGGQAKRIERAGRGPGRAPAPPHRHHGRPGARSRRRSFRADIRRTAAAPLAPAVEPSVLERQAVVIVPHAGCRVADAAGRPPRPSSSADEPAVPVRGGLGEPAHVAGAARISLSWRDLETHALRPV